jgi:hypothetical protein
MSVFHKGTQTSKTSTGSAKRFSSAETPAVRDILEQEHVKGEVDACSSLLLSDLIPEFRQALMDGEVIDLVFPGADVPVEMDGIENTQAVLLDPDQPSAVLRKLSAGRRYILLRNVLQNISDYRSVLREAFDRLATGGWLIVTVPHQFLAERKFRLPSRYGSKALRFYTPASLTAEIEEALDATAYRVRLLRDDDASYEYERSIHERPGGHQRIIAVLQKIARPPWAGQMNQDDMAEVVQDPDDAILPIDAGPTVTHVLAASTTSVKSILVLKLDHRGDYLMAQPALLKLRAHFPHAQITFVCGTWNAELAEASGIFDSVLSFNFFAEDASIKREPRRNVKQREFAELMRNRTFDLAVDLRYYEDTRDLMQFVSAQHKAGFDRWDSFPWMDIKLNLPCPTLDGRAAQGFWPVEAFSCPDRNRRDGSIACLPARVRPRSTAVWGPYVGLDEGTYELTLLIDKLGGTENIEVDVVCDQAETKLFAGRVSVNAANKPVVKFTLPKRTHDLEVRIFTPWFYQLGFHFRGIQYRRHGIIVGEHQLETMQLLVELIAMRLRLPYLQETQKEYQL